MVSDRACSLVTHPPVSSRRATWTTRSWRPVPRSVPRDRLVQVQDHAGDARPGGQLGGVDVLRRRARRRRPAASSPPSASGAYSVRCFVEQLRQHLRLLGRRRRARGALRTPRRSAPSASLPPSRDDPLGEDAGRLDVGRVVQQHQRLLRRVRPRPLARCTPRGSGRRTPAGSGAGTSAASRCTARGGTGRRPCRSATRASGSSARPSSPAGWYGLTLGPPILSTSSPLTASALSRTNSASSRKRDCRASSRLNGSRSCSSARRLRRLPVRAAGDHQPDEVLHVPAAVA